VPLHAYSRPLPAKERLRDAKTTARCVRFSLKALFQEAFFYELFLQNQTAFSTCRWLFAT